jgi:hypothetical protein
MVFLILIYNEVFDFNIVTDKVNIINNRINFMSATAFDWLDPNYPPL